MSLQLLKKLFGVMVMVLVFSVPLIFLRTSVYPQIVPKTALFQALTTLAILIGAVLFFSQPRSYRFKGTPLFWAALLLGGALVITSFSGVDSWRSLWSIQERSLGVVTWLHALGFLMVSGLFGHYFDWRKVWTISFFAAGIIAIIALIQVWYPGVVIPHEAETGRPGSTFGNPTFMAGYLIFHFFVGLYYLLEKGRDLSWRARLKDWEYRLWLVATFLPLLGIILSRTRGTFLGLLGGLLILLIFVSFNSSSKRVRRGAFVFLVLIIFGSGVFAFTRESTFWSAVPVVNRFQDISLTESSLAPRLLALKAGWQGFLERPLLGWGWDNFNVVFNEHYDPKILELGYTETRFDKPHNAWLEYLVAGGALLGLTVLVFWGAAVYEIWRLRKSEERLLVPFILAAFLGYTLHAFFVFETIGSLLMMTFTLGWVDSLYRKSLTKTEEKNHKKEATSLSSSVSMVFWGGFIFWVIVTYFINYQPIRAARYQALGFLTINARPADAIRYFDLAVSIAHPQQWIIKRDYAAVASESHFYNPSLISEETVRRGIRYMEEVVRDHPLDAYNHYALLDMYNQASDVDPSYLEKAEKEAARALELSPQRQQILFSLAKTKSIQGKNEEAYQILKDALALSPNVPDAHFYFGLLAHVIDKKEEGYEHLKKAIELGRKFKNANEYLVVGNFFADSDHLEDAIEMYKGAKKLEPDNLEVRVKLGMAAYFAGKRDLAKEELSFVVQKLKSDKQPIPADIEPALRDLGL